MKRLVTPCRLDPAAVEEYVNSHGFSPTRLYCVKGLAAPKMVTILGVIPWIEYVTRKRFEGQSPFIFHHDFEGENRPYLAAGQGRYFLLGGGYTVTPHGIEDDPADDERLPKGRRFLKDLSVPQSVTGMGDMWSIGYEQKGKEKAVDFHQLQNPPVLVYNHLGQPKRLWIVPVASARRVSL